MKDIIQWKSFGAMHISGKPVVVFRTEPDPAIDLSDLNGYMDDIQDWIVDNLNVKKVLSFGVVDLPGLEMISIAITGQQAINAFQAYCNATPSV